MYLESDLLHLPIEIFTTRCPNFRSLDDGVSSRLELLGLFDQTALEQIHTRIEECLHGIWHRTSWSTFYLLLVYDRCQAMSIPKRVNALFQS
jgi:hypothetical protein